MPEFVLRLAAALSNVCDPIAVLLFGSWAQGRADQYSDVDLIVVLRKRPRPPLRAALLDSVRIVPMSVDLLIWTAEDVVVARTDPHGFAGSVLPGAVVVTGALPTDVAEI